MSKKSRRPYTKVKENLEIEEQLRLVEAVLYNLPWFNLLHQLFTELKWELRTLHGFLPIFSLSV